MSTINCPCTQPNALVTSVFGYLMSISNITYTKLNCWSLPKTCYSRAFFVPVIATPPFRNLDLKFGSHPWPLSFSNTSHAMYQQIKLFSNTSRIKIKLPFTASTATTWPYHHCYFPGIIAIAFWLSLCFCSCFLALILNISASVNLFIWIKLGRTLL